MYLFIYFMPFLAKMYALLNEPAKMSRGHQGWAFSSKLVSISFTNTLLPPRVPLDLKTCIKCIPYIQSIDPGVALKVQLCTLNHFIGTVPTL